MDGLHKYFGSWITKKVLKIPVLREKTVSLLFFKKEREKKNEPNKKENLKIYWIIGCPNVLVDGFSKDRSIYLFALGPSAHQNLLFTKDVFKTPVLREKTFSLHVL